MSKNLLKVKGLAIYLSIAIVGVIVSMSTRVVFDDYLGFGYSLSVALSYFLGMIWGFYMTKTFAFNAKESGNTQRELIKYVCVAFSALGLTVMVASITLEMFKWYIKENSENHTLIRDLLNHPVLKAFDMKFVANLCGIGAGFFVNYFGHKFLTFRSTGTYDKYLVKQELRRQNKVRQ